MDDDDDESEVLLAPTVKARAAAARLKAVGRGVIWNRVVILLVLTALVFLFLFAESQISTLTLQLETATTKLHELETVTSQHATVIDRFNSSVTNADVLDQLRALTINLTATGDELYEELQKTKREIRKEMDETVNELNSSVEGAERQISDQVDKVKKDVEQYVMTTQDQFSMENSFMIYQLAGTFTVLSCLISMWHMTAHLRKLNQPDVQRKILAILWMSPIYAVTSWFSLVFHSAEGYLAIFKDFYEAYVIYQFLSFCIAVLGKGDRNVVIDLLARHADHLTPPFRLFGCFELCGCCKGPGYESNRQLADAILLQCQLFAMQFVFCRPLITTAMVVLQKMEYYGAGDGPMDYRAPQFYLTIVQNISIFVAFTGLLKFYHAVDKDLAWCRPFAKFLCIKGVVFMTFWQGLALSVLAEATDVGGVDATEWARSAQNFLICLEMLLFSIAHFYCFPTEEWEEGYRIKHSGGKFGDSIALGDFFTDLKLILKPNGGGSKNGKSMTTQHATILEGDDESEGNHTEVLSVATTSDEDDERAVAEALQQSLGALGDDPDIAEAKRRLLESKVLSPDFFDYNDKNVENDLKDPGVAEACRRLLLGDYNDIEDLIVGRKVDVESATRHNVSAQSKAAGDETCAAPTERTSLLSHPFKQDVSPLRPSIFTTVASMAEKEHSSFS